MDRCGANEYLSGWLKCKLDSSGFEVYLCIWGSDSVIRLDMRIMACVCSDVSVLEVFNPIALPLSLLHYLFQLNSYKLHRNI